MSLIGWRCKKCKHLYSGYDEESETTAIHCKVQHIGRKEFLKVYFDEGRAECEEFEYGD